mmetsp:Transcript_14122/g.28883  ORF Transcript_14122/g.28883 Transcript_14122/m.28883 type:complete len:173 (-) Transcript_14122:2994-3512(-)
MHRTLPPDPWASFCENRGTVVERMSHRCTTPSKPPLSNPIVVGYQRTRETLAWCAPTKVPTILAEEEDRGSSSRIQPSVQEVAIVVCCSNDGSTTETSVAGLRVGRADINLLISVSHNRTDESHEELMSLAFDDDVTRRVTHEEWPSKEKATSVAMRCSFFRLSFVPELRSS